MLRAEKTLRCGQTTYHSYMCTGTVLEARGGCNPGTKHQLMQQILGLFSIWRLVKHSTTPAKENRAIQMTDEQVPPPSLQNQQLLIFCAPKGTEETSQCSSQGCRKKTQIALLGGRKKNGTATSEKTSFLRHSFSCGVHTYIQIKHRAFCFSGPDDIFHRDRSYQPCISEGCGVHAAPQQMKLAFRSYNGHEKESCS